jgi:hypothetical protein
MNHVGKMVENGTHISSDAGIPSEAKRPNLPDTFSNKSLICAYLVLDASLPALRIPPDHFSQGTHATLRH